MNKTKYRITFQNSWLSSNFKIEKYIYVPDGPDDFYGMPTSLAGWKWVLCNEYDIPELHKLLNTK